jgi:O-antigen ligase
LPLKHIILLKIIFSNKLNTLADRQAFTVFFACLLVVSMMVSPFLLSISMWGFVAVALWESAVVCRRLGVVHNFRSLPAWWKILAWSFQNLFRKPPLALFLLLLIVPALSFFWSGDQVYWLDRTVKRLPFLVLPWAFANLPVLTGRQLRLVLYALVGALTIICLGAAVNFALHFDDALAGIGRGDPIPVPRSHIRFSLILAAGIVAGGWLWLEGFYWRRRWERRVLGAALVFLFLFIHILSVRSGIVGLYVVLLFSLGWYVWRTRRWGIGLIALIILLLVPAVAMETMPSFRMRVHYMIWDWQQYRQNSGNTYSDAERMISLRVGWQLWQEHPWFGIGAGDLPTEVQRVVDAQYPQYSDAPKLPHNQFLYILTGTGVFGLTLSLIAFFGPIAVRRYRQYYLFAAFQILIFTSFLVEYTIETAIGVAFYLFYTLWFMKMAKEG